MSISPDSSAATRVASDLMVWKVTSVRLCSGLPHQPGLGLYTVFTLGSWLTMVKGPVPFDLSANGLSEVAEDICACTAPFASAHFLDIMYQVSHSACRIGLGEVKTKSTVWSSTFTAFMVAGARDFICDPGECMRSVEKTTSSAVKSSPPWNFTPLRR